LAASLAIAAMLFAFTCYLRSHDVPKRGSIRFAAAVLVALASTAELAREDTVIAGPHMLFPSLGRLQKTESGYSWAPVSFTNQWVQK
jgi:hypothetical protein